MSKSATPSHSNAKRRLLDAILSGKYPPGSRLPPERELAQILGASRATLREVLGHLGGMRLIEAKRSSGVLVRPISEWRIEVLPDYLASRLGKEDVTGFVRDLLSFRRELVFALFRVAAPSLRSGDLDGARTLAAQAWDVREDRDAFMALNVASFRACIEATKNLPTIWLANPVCEVLLATAGVMPSSGAVPRGYLDWMMRVFSALERQDADGACAVMREYYDREDRGILGIKG